MSAQEIKALNKFSVVQKPEEANIPRRGVYAELMIALKKIASHESIYLSKEEVEKMNLNPKLNSLRMSIFSASKRRGFRAGVIEKNGGFYFFNK